jgi:hypothetical protein
MTRATQESPFMFRNKDRRSGSHVSNRQHQIRIGRTPAGRLQKHAFLGAGSVAPGLDEDDSAITAVTTMAAGEHDRAYEIPGR